MLYHSLEIWRADQSLLEDQHEEIVPSGSQLSSFLTMFEATHLGEGVKNLDGFRITVFTLDQTRQGTDLHLLFCEGIDPVSHVDCRNLHIIR